MAALTILTGASRGLGEALLQELVERGEQVIVIGRTRPDARATADASEGLVSCIDSDLAEAGQWSDTHGLPHELGDELARRSFSELTYINNAGSVRPIGMIGRLATKDLLASIAVNLAAPALIADTCLRWTAPRGIPARVINISSGAASRPIAGWSAYCGSKAGARMFFEVMSLEGTCPVIHIDPGVMDTGMQGDIRSAGEDSFPQVGRFRELKNEGKLASPADVARSIVAANYGATFASGRTP